MGAPDFIQQREPFLLYSQLKLFRIRCRLETIRNSSVSVPSKPDTDKFFVNSVHFKNILIYNLVPLQEASLFIGIVRIFCSKFPSVIIETATLRHFRVYS